VNYGDGTGTSGLAITGGGFSLSHEYATAGTFAVTVGVTDDDDGSGSRTVTVTVLSSAQALGVLSSQVAAFGSAGTMTKSEVNALSASLDPALKSIMNGNTEAARNQLGSFIHKVEAMRISKRISAATAAALIDDANRTIASID
jgi:hypothetical protein